MLKDKKTFRMASYDDGGQGGDVGTKQSYTKANNAEGCSLGCGTSLVGDGSVFVHLVHTSYGEALRLREP